MITLAIILFIIGIFVARNVLWPIAVVLLGITLLFWAVHQGTYAYY